MESEYDRKFEEMKKYIPFLEDMITRLESTSTPSSNPRQAQLDKIRSLRDLLSNKKKRMKMENLLKCEQVLINLYAKVEQRDKKTIHSGFSIDTPTAKEKSELEAVRNKLKTVVKQQENLQDTLPEILPRSEVNDERTSGTKEPALFQRRPNQQSGQTSKEAQDSLTSPPNSASKRNYTRVLVSPESNTRHPRWSPSETTVEKPLFSRRSPRKSPKRRSPSYYKKERKKSKDKPSRKQRDLNITLNVPEESLNSLNTKDILSRIIHCSDGDVDIDTLRELRKQILGELQKTGAKDDISDLILKSYNKSMDKTKTKKPTKKEEIEEGELSDSESEAIESIYGSLVVKEPGQAKTSSDKDTQPRKIQICLVINSDNKSEQKVIDLPKQDSTDFAELEMYENEDKKEIKINAENDSSKTNDDEKKTCETSKEECNNSVSQKITEDKVVSSPQDNVIKPKQYVCIPDTNSTPTTGKSTSVSNECEISTVKEATQFKANFYKPLTEPSNLEHSKSVKDKDTDCVQVGTDTETKPAADVFDIENTLKEMETSPEIPLLHERTIDKQPANSTLSEIDILQALKKEILSEITVPGTENATPPLHQPKVMKVANAQANQILPKKRISIETYKEKSVTSLQPHLNQVSYKEEQMKKTSLKLTDKECERFFNVPTIPFGEEEDESLDENDDGDIQASDVYGDLAPKSPDNEDFSDANSAPPVIIPADPIKNVPTNNKTDVDMRALPLVSPNSTTTPKMFNSTCTSSNNDPSTDKVKIDFKTDQGNSHNRPLLVDPRVRRDLNPNISTLSPNPHASNPERTPRQMFPSVSSNSTPNSIMTPNSRSYEMTPTHQSFEIDQSSRKHVYVPTMTSWDREKSVPKDIRTWEKTDSTGDRKSRIDDSRESCWNPQKDDISHNSRFNDSFNSDKYGKRYVPDMTVAPNQSYARKEAPMTPLVSSPLLPTPSPLLPTPSHPFGRLECPSTPSHPFGRVECPPTPSHPFGRYDCPPTPNHPFGRLECPPTPSHPFGRLECPPTPNHSFGRLECPSTPSHPFGRIDCPPTPIHSFGRSDCPSTPSHPFGRSEGLPPHSFIGTDGSSTPNLFGRNECTSSQTPKHSFGRSEPLKSQYGRSDFSTQNYTKDPRLNRKLDTESKSQYDERDRSYCKDQDRYRGSSYSTQKYSGSSSYRHYDRDLGASRNSKYKYFAPDQTGRQFNKDQERRDHVADRSLSKDRESSATYIRDRSYDSDCRRYEEVGSRREYREKSIGRSVRPDETRSSVRSPSTTKYNSIEPERNTLSVKSNTGRSFTIDTSINATFQKIIDSAKEMQGFVNSFDMRRQRAASVGRSLTRESSVGRVMTQPSNSHEKKKEAFQRASSVGRELVDSNKDKRSFQEIKADFKSCRFSGSQVCSNKSSETRNNYKQKINAEHSVNNRKDVYEKQRDGQRRSESVKPSYSPRMNYRDPRMRKLNKDKTEKSNSDSHGRKSGIVYSNDNIVTGSIMASGYGVKNYKIPKIKRAKEENEDCSEKTDIISKTDDKEKRVTKNSNITEKGYSKEKLQVSEQRGKVNSNDVPPHKVTGTAKDSSKRVNDSIDTGVFTERRRTRSSVRSIEEADTDVTGKVRKCKKRIYDSDSDDALNTNGESVIKNTNIERKDVDPEDSDQKGKDTNKSNEKNIDSKSIDVDPERKDFKNEEEVSRDKSVDSKNKKTSDIFLDMNVETEDMTIKDMLNPKAKLTEHVSPSKAKINRNITSADLGSNFGIDELEMFSDNIVADPVLENITALIADLDNDLSSSRSDLGHNFTKEISLENMMQNISSPEKDNLLDNDDDSSKLLEEIDKISQDKEEVPNENQIKSSSPMNDSLVSLGLETKMGLNKEDSAKNIKDERCLQDTPGNLPTQSDALRNEDKENITKLPSLVMSINEDIDSTTEVIRNEKPIEDKSKLDEQNIEACSTPDSTINTDDALLKSTNDESLPGSTNEVTSTELIESKPGSTKEMPPALDSIGSLLSILQDKSKIKELLLMLGDQTSENDKIKKKLEKLSEIVSDDEESCDVPTSKLDHTDIDKVDFSEIPHLNIDKTETIDETGLEGIDNESLSKDSSLSMDSNQNSSKIDDDAKTSDIEDEVQKTEEQNTETKPKKKPGKKTKCLKKTRGKAKKGTTTAAKRITRATAADTKPKVKKPPRELMQLQEDIKEMFIRDDVLSATGIRMCRLAKLVDEKTSPTKEQILPEVEPVVVLQKFKDTMDKNCDLEKIKKKKTGPKIKVKCFANSIPELAMQDKKSVALKHKPGPKSKTTKKESDPYTFESDSFSDTITEKASEAGSSSDTDSESDSLESSKSFGSTELLADLKKKTKRRRRGWQAGVIKTKTKKKKIEQKTSNIIPADTLEHFLPEKVSILDTNCFTDRNYCFRKNLISYSCRLCKYTGTDIVLHYRNQHPHVVIPLSRMPPEVAKEAIEQCQEINFQAISNIPSDKYICTFCYKEFTNSKSVLETFFWHIVSTHTGEYKQHCSQCDNVNECPFNLDIPPPPKDAKGQLIGFICKKCNFTQISLENLKTHIILHHNDEQTAVYRINLSIMTKKSINSLLRRSESDQAVLQTSTRRSLDTSISDLSENTERDDNEGVKTRTSARKANTPIVPPIQSKITFEGDDNISEVSDVVSESGEGSIKMERTDSENADAMSNNEESLVTDVSEADRVSDAEDQLPLADLLPSSDIMNYPHFKINLTESGAKEYFCCINGNYHFKTTLLISMKKHVKSKHSEPWEGYCFVCKVIVTPQGVHRFNDCLQHYLDKHMDNFPIFEEELPTATTESPTENTSVAKPYINVRPLSELITRTADTDSQKEVVTPVIQSVMSLGTPTIESPRLSPTYAARLQEKQVEQKVLKYEEHQAEVLSKKYYLVVQDMMVPDKLVKVFKCAGVYCKYATDSTEDALAHATTHQRIGGADALNCCYCDFDSAGNAVDLVMHVFKSHGNCRYCCEHCFYRAASSQTVVAHSSKVHGKPPVPGSVLRTATVSSLPVARVNILTRQEAVSYYICGHSENGESCKFRTYTPDKFCEHLLQRHAAATAHPCNLCPVLISTATELVQHMKMHGLKLYQCTWCVHGADNESEMLSHVSSLHPDKQPQAYIRIITNKDGSNALRVLPLALLSMYKFPVKDVIPSIIKDHPVREAERSTEMEALIGPFMADPMEPPVTSPTDPLVETTETPIQTSEIPEGLIEPPEDVKPVVNVQPLEPTTPAPQLVPPPDLTPAVTIPPPTDSTTPSILNPLPVSVAPVKKEPSETIFTDIVVLDSDEEDTPNAEAQSVIDVSDDEASTSSKKDTFKIIPIPNLFTCPQCKQNYKNMGGFKKHLISCVTDPNRTVQCPHCSYVAENLDNVTWHYVAHHTRKSTYECSLCNALLASEALARKHLKSVHKQTNAVFTKKKEEGTPHFTLTVKEPPPKEKILPKRKLSGPKTDPIPAKRRFEPQDIDQLPITPILDQLVYCSRCEFSTKVRLNMVRHLQLHAEQQPVPQTAPVNPVPHLESNEKHFDKMVNLASSSVVNRTPDKPRQEHSPSVTLLIPPEAAARYPKYVSERQRHTCGAKGCSYISVDEAMLRRHWEALHSGSSDFHCVHCPPHQHLDTSKPLTALRIVSHLKMHDSTLYACSSCSYYHFKREAAEKHVADTHVNGRVLVVREEQTAPVSPAPTQSTSAPTMDLKPWQCGLCKFKSMLRPEVVDHCSKFHQSKMQFRCIYCPFRTSTIENISKHQANSHTGMPEEVFYYYYREGSIPDENDGTPLWVKQRQKLLVTQPASEPEVKVEAPVSPVMASVPPVVVPAPPLAVDLNLVKKEVNESTGAGPSSAMEDLCNQFGQFSEPNGIKYKCPLCAVVMEETRELMQSHLYEELNYRKWSCGLCSYKAFHKAGLTDHMTSEHHRQYDHIELPTDVNIERWVTGVLDHQASIIDKRKENLQKQRIIYTKPGLTENAVSKETASKYPEKDLEQAFGTFGLPDHTFFRCSKCTFLTKNETAFRDHLEMEINKIRWCCNICPENFQTQHEARLHSKAHDGPSWPKEAIRDPAMRAIWVTTAIEKQKKVIQSPPSSLPQTAENPQASIDKRKENLQRQKSNNDTPGLSSESVVNKETAAIYPEKDLEQAFGAFGSSKGVMFSCPKCDFLSKSETAFRDHLEMELNKIRWCCTHCPENFQTYHEARFHGKGHDGPSWPKEAIRDPAMRATWVSTAIEKQKKVIQSTPTASSLPPTPEKFVPDSDNSLLVVRYARKIPTPDQVNVRRKRAISDSDEEKLVIDEPAKKKERQCPYCDYKSMYSSNIRVHALSHFGLKAYTCFYCSYDSYTKKAVAKHVEQTHIDKPVRVKLTELPPDAKKQDDVTLTCLVCEKPVREADTHTHLHNNVKPEFSQSLIVQKCGICSTLCCDSESLAEHQQKTHPGEPIQYSMYTLGTDTFICLYCDSKFQYLKDYRAHHMAAHPSLRFTVTSSSVTPSGSKAVTPIVVKRCARKSTTKLPNFVAKKSTTKLPYSVPDSFDDEYSYYGTRPPSLDQYSDVTTLMSFCNRMMPFSLKQLSEHLNIEPRVLVTDIKNSSDLKFNL